MPNALVFLADGSEEMEVVITVDVLRRGGVSFVVYTILDYVDTVMNPAVFFLLFIFLRIEPCYHVALQQSAVIVMHYVVGRLEYNIHPNTLYHTVLPLTNHGQ
jgi:putative intracellular protease/amidase